MRRWQGSRRLEFRWSQTRPWNVRFLISSSLLIFIRSIESWSPSRTRIAAHSYSHLSSFMPGRTISGRPSHDSCSQPTARLRMSLAQRTKNQRMKFRQSCQTRPVSFGSDAQQPCPANSHTSSPSRQQDVGGCTAVLRLRSSPLLRTVSYHWMTRKTRWGRSNVAVTACLHTLRYKLHRCLTGLSRSESSTRFPHRIPQTVSFHFASISRMAS